MNSRSTILNQITQANNVGLDSGTYGSQSINNESIITEAYDRIGVDTSTIAVRQWDSALTSMNSIVALWANKGIRQWMISSRFVNLNPGVEKYPLLDVFDRPLVRDIFSIKSKQLISLTSQIVDGRVKTINGFVFPMQADVLFNLNENIDENFYGLDPQEGVTFTFGDQLSVKKVYNCIDMIGIKLAHQNNNDPLYIELSCSSLAGGSSDVISQESIAMPVGDIIWLKSPVSVPIDKVTIKNIGGNVLTLNQIYITSLVSQIPMSLMSRDSYMNLNRFNSLGNLPSRYFHEKKAQQNLYVWPSPSINADSSSGKRTSFNVLDLAYIAANQDVGGLMNAPSVPPLFVEALTAELACKLALKEGKVDILQFLRAEADEAYRFACEQDNEAVSIHITSDWQGE